MRTHRTVAIAARSTRLTLDGLFTIGRAHVTVPGRAVTFAGRIHPYVSGQRVSVTEALNGRRFKTVSIVPACVAHGDVGVFKLTVSAPAPGGVSVSVRHKRGKTMKSFHVLGTFKALETALRPDQTGQFVELVQQRLAALHIFIRQTGVYDLGTQLALDAYHRLLGEGEGIYTLNSKTLTALLNGEGAFHVRYPGQGQHAEGDLSDQLLAFINGGQVHWIFPISSGKPSTPTILGQFQVYYKEPEYTSDGMYFSSFFHGGYAIHGYDPAPPFPASHGCMRLPMVDAITAFNWINVGDWVDTYYT
ncbi:MAG TPA: L,D-transpeptidase [Solirubrobacteraceae bacterium]|nr:L,D-transpeptidase [Solirubrobacteraceae bacterium]